MPSARVTAPTLTFSQSASVLGKISTVSLSVAIVPTAAKMLSESGSMTYFISSLTGTTGFMMPATAGGAAGDAFDGKQFAVSAPTEHNPMTAPTHPRMVDMRAPAVEDLLFIAG